MAFGWSRPGVLAIEREGEVSEQVSSERSISLGVQWVCDKGHWNGPGVVPLDLINRPKRCQHMPFGGPYRECGRKVRDAELTARFVEAPARRPRPLESRSSKGASS